MSETATVVLPHEQAKKTGGDQGFINILILFLAVLIDLIDLLPLEFIGLGFIYELPISPIGMLFLGWVGVPPVKAIGEGLFDVIPILDVFPWCTLAVLDKKFGVKLPLLTKLFNKL